jgi:short-subunit dehydrogenase
VNVFITGASSGLGRALAVAYARAYASQPAVLGLLARRYDMLSHLAASLPARPSLYQVDVNDHAAVRAAALLHIRQHGCPDIVIANAGISAGTLTELREDLAVFERIVRTNLLSVVATFQPFVEAMKSRKRGTLVVIASVAGIRGLPGAAAYSASKAAVMSYAESLRLELRPYGVKVVIIAPGYVATSMTEHNPYPMPFLMTAEAFAVRALRVIARGDRFRVIPWQMGIVARILRWMPRPIYDALFTRAPRKPREIAPDVVSLGHTVGLDNIDTQVDRLGPPTFSQRELDLGLPVVPLSIAAAQVHLAQGHPSGTPDHAASTIKVWRGKSGWDKPE